MKHLSSRWLFTLMALLMPAAACATITCSAFIPNYTVTYISGQAPSTTLYSSSIQMSCTRTAQTDPTSVHVKTRTPSTTYGTPVYPAAANGVGELVNWRYVLGVACETENPYTGNNTYLITWPNSTTFGTSTTTDGAFYACVTPAQYPRAGTYTDTYSLPICFNIDVSPTCSYGLITASSAITITVQNSCDLVSGPGNITLNYTSFQNSSATQSTTFALICSLGYAPLSITATPASGTLTGIAYSLAVDAPITGTGANQTYNITGTATALQSGTCAAAAGCTANQMTTLTINY